MFCCIFHPIRLYAFLPSQLRLDERIQSFAFLQSASSIFICRREEKEAPNHPWKIFREVQDGLHYHNLPEGTTYRCKRGRRGGF